MNKPTRRAPFFMSDPSEFHVPHLFSTFTLHTREVYLLDVTLTFPGIDRAITLSDTEWYVWIEPTYDPEEVWLLLYDALTEAVKLHEVWQLDPDMTAPEDE